jgi:hypothetical protein
MMHSMTGLSKMALWVMTLSIMTVCIITVNTPSFSIKTLSTHRYEV